MKLLGLAILSLMLFSIYSMRVINATNAEILWTDQTDLKVNPKGLALDSTGVYVSAYVYVENSHVALLEKRSISDGRVLWSQYFDNDTLTPGNVAVDKTGIYISLLKGSEGSLQKRSLSDGSFIWSVNNNQEGLPAYDILVDDSGIYNLVSSSTELVIEKRSLDNGNLIWKKSIALAQMQLGAVDKSGIYLIGYERDTTEPFNLYRFWIDKRSISDGSVIWSKDLTTKENIMFPNGIYIYNNYIYLIGIEALYGKRSPINVILEERSVNDGNILLSKTWGLQQAPVLPLDICTDSTGIYVSGWSSPGNIWTVCKFDFKGDPLWNYQFKSSSRTQYVDIASFVLVDNTGVYVTGYSSINDYQQLRIEKMALGPSSSVQSPGSVTTSGSSGVPGYGLEIILIGVMFSIIILKLARVYNKAKMFMLN